MTMTESTSGGNGASQRKIYITIAGLPLSFNLHWPFRRSTSGADFYVLHAEIRLENTEGLHAQVSVNMSQTLREVLPSLEPADTEAPVINALRKEVDNKQLEFVKSGKLIPVAFSSRQYNIRRKQWAFHHAADDQQLAEFLERNIYWGDKLNAGETWIIDPIDLLYLDTTADHMLGVARQLAAAGLIHLEGDRARPTDALRAQREEIEGAMKRAFHDLEKKHEFERG